MDKISTILVPYDFSDISRTALDYAVNYIGNSTDMELVLIYAAADAQSQNLESKFKAIRESYGKLLRSPMSWEVSQEGLITAILKAGKSKQADLIIMGTAGADAKEDTSTNTSELVHEADCPVLVVPKEPGEFQVKNIALVLGRDEIDDTSVLGTLLDVARRFNAQVHVLTIENEPGTYGYSKTDEKNETLLEYYLESFYADHMFIENPDVVEGISDYVSDKEIDMIAIFPRNHVRHGEPSEGRLTHMLTLKADTPILAID